MSDPILEALWKKVLDNWDDDAVHGAFMSHCQDTRQLPEAAARYKGMTGDHERGSSAEKRLGGVAILAMASLQHEPRSDPSKAPRLIAALISVLFVVATAYLLHRLTNS
ncbi:MAG: hypothetical protein H6718_09165 [Polyangiaceae bacterium]|nr:hypothetical protein [Polyangiaceae bacterium]MCB9606428.1 hypothetical protein [Polyangiaceae bacterium]